MKKVTDTPIYNPNPERTEREVQHSIIKEGRTARRLGRPKKPPPYRIKDWEIDWCNGWRWEDEDIKAKRK